MEFVGTGRAGRSQTGRDGSAWDDQPLMAGSRFGGEEEEISTARKRRLALAALIALAGFVVMSAGWVGVSGTRVISDQLAYVVSGGVLGLALLAVSAALFIGDFMAVQERSMREQTRLLRALHDALGVAPGVPSRQDGGAAGQAAGPVLATSDTLVVVAGGTRVHRADCQLVRHKRGVSPVDPARPRDEGLSPCAVCDPPVD